MPKTVSLDLAKRLRAAGCNGDGTLSDLLDELEAQGWGWELRHIGTIHLRKWGVIEMFEAGNCEDAAGESLAWVLKQGKEAAHAD